MTKLALLVVALSACVVEPGDGSATVSNVPGNSTDVTDIPRIASNSLLPSTLTSSALTTDRLTAASAAAMGQTANARTVLAYAAECALHDTQSVTFTVAGTEHTVAGSLGIAPGWTAGALDASDAAWVSACVMARVNLTGTVVVISARGLTTALDAGASERADYQIEEGAFWGNAFVDLGVVAGHACDGVDQLRDDSYGDLPLRQCAQWNGVTSSGATPCGFAYAGACAEACASTGPYSECAGAAEEPRSEVVTTFLYGAPR
jgi:hypothetical protein